MQSGLTTTEAKARERLVAMQIAAVDGETRRHSRDYATLQVARMLDSRAETGSKARRRVLGFHDIRVAFFHKDMFVRMPREV